MDIRSIIDPDASDTARAKPASRQRSDANVPYPQTQSSFQSHYEAQASAYKGPRETRPPQPPPLLPPAHPTQNDLRSPSASSHNSSRSPYQQTPSSVISGGQYPFPQLPAQSLAHGFQPAQFSQRESHMASTPTGYQPYGQPVSMSQTPTVTTPISSHTYSNHTRQSSTRSLSTPTSTKSNVVKESPKGSLDYTFDPIKAAYESHTSQQFLSQQGTPLRPPSMTGRATSILRRDSPSAPYEHQRNHSAGSYGHQQGMSSSPSKDRPGSSTVSPLAPVPRQSLSHAQNYYNKHEREKSLSVSPKTKLSSELNLRQSNEDSIVKSKDRANVSADMNSAKVEISEDRLGVHSSQEQSAIRSPSRSRSLGMKVILNSPSMNEISSIVKESTVQTKKLPSQVSNNRNELRIDPIHSERSESESSRFAVDTRQNSENSLSDAKPLAQHFSISSKPQTQTQAKDYLKEQTSPDFFPPHLSPLLQTKNFSSVSVPVTNSVPSSSRAIPQSSFNEPSSTVSFQRQPSPAQTARYSSSPAVPNSTQSQLTAKSPLKEQSPQISFFPNPSPSQTVEQSALPAVPISSQPQTTPKSTLKEETPPTSFPPYPAAPQSDTHSPLATIGIPSIPQRVRTPPIQPQTTMSPAPSSQTVMSSSSTSVTEVIEQQTATKKVAGDIVAFASSSPSRRRKRRRFEEIPIFARSCRKSWPPGNRNTGAVTKSRSPVRKATHPRQPIQPTRPVKQEPNGHAVPINDTPLPKAHSTAPDSGLLGPWEDSITNTTPSNEYIRHLSDFLYHQVIGRLDVDVGPAGGGPAAGAVIEIEAKIGQLIDKNTNTRLRLPVTTECVLSKDDPGLRVNFKSSMTEVRPTPASLTQRLLIPLNRPSIVP